MTPVTVLFFTEQAHGPMNNAAGIGQALLRRGHRVVFVVEPSFAGELERLGLEERLAELSDAPPGGDPGQFWKDYIRETAPALRRTTIEQIELFIEPTWRALVEGARYVDDRLAEIMDEVRPDVIVEDNVLSFPAIVRSDIPWVRVVSCNPLELDDPLLPPKFSGYPVGDPTGWSEFRARYREVVGPLHAEFDQWLQDRGCPPLPGLEFIHGDAAASIYLYPRELDYPRSERPATNRWLRIDSCVREVSDEYELPDCLRAGGGSLVYLSLGSLGSADAPLMQRLIDLLGRTEHRVIVSLGPQADDLTLAENMTGMPFLPQPAVLPLVDLVITHGGNNTVTEAFRLGKPQIALPLFWDQHDNAQRLSETGYGARLPTYDFDDHELTDAIARLLADPRLAGRLRAAADRQAAVDGRVLAAGRVERAALGPTPSPAR